MPTKKAGGVTKVEVSDDTGSTWDEVFNVQAFEAPAAHDGEEMADGTTERTIYRYNINIRSIDVDVTSAWYVTLGVMIAATDRSLNQVQVTFSDASTMVFKEVKVVDYEQVPAAFNENLKVEVTAEAIAGSLANVKTFTA